MDPIKVKQLFSQMDESEQEDFVNNLSEDEASSLFGALKQPEVTAKAPITPTQISEAIKARQFGALTPEGAEGFRVGFAEPFVKAGQRIQQLFASPQRAAEIGQQAAEDERLRQAQLAREPVAFQASQRLGKVAGVVAPALAVPGPGMLGITSGLGRISYGGAVGGGFGLVSGEPVQDKGQFIKQGLTGAGLGGGIQTVVEAAALAPRVMASMFTTADEAASSKGLLKPNPIFEQGLKTEQVTGTKLTPGQITGSPALSEMKTPTEFVNKQAKDTFRYFKTLQNKISNTKQTPANLANRFNQVTNDTFDQLVEARRKVGNFAYGKFKSSVKEIQADTLRSKMDEIANEAVPGTDEGLVISLRDKLSKTLDDSGGTLTTEQFLGWKQRIDDLLAGKSDIFKNLKSANQRRIGAQLSDALWVDIKNTADLLEKTGKKSPALLLKDAHRKYAEYSQPIEELKQSALGALFKSGEKFSPDTVGEKLMSLKPSEVSGMYGILDKYYPSGLRQYQATKLHDAMKSSIELTGPAASKLAGETKFNPQAAIQSMTKNGSLRSIFDKDPQLMRDVNRGLVLLDRLSDKLSVGSGGTQSIGTVGKQAAQIAASQNPIFSAGFFAQHLGPVGLWKLTSTEQGRSILKTLATTPANSPKFIAASEELLSNYTDYKAE